ARARAAGRGRQVCGGARAHDAAAWWRVSARAARAFVRSHRFPAGAPARGAPPVRGSEPTCGALLPLTRATIPPTGQTETRSVARRAASLLQVRASGEDQAARGVS